MAKTALENAQELLESLEGSFERKRERERRGEAAIGWAVVAVSEQLERIATQLEALDKKFSKHKHKME